MTVVRHVVIHNRLWSSGRGEAGGRGRGREGRGFLLARAAEAAGGGRRRVDDAQVAPPVGTRVVFVVPGGEVAVYIRLVDGLGAAQHPIAQHNLAGDAVACVERAKALGRTYIAWRDATGNSMPGVPTVPKPPAWMRRQGPPMVVSEPDHPTNDHGWGLAKMREKVQI